MSTPREFCWIYRHKKTTMVAEVLRPRRRVTKMRYRVRYVGSIVSFELDYARFHEEFKFVGRKGSAKATLAVYGIQDAA